MKTSTKDKIEGSFHKAKGAFKEQVAKAPNHRASEGRRKVRKESGEGPAAVGPSQKTQSHT